MTRRQRPPSRAARKPRGQKPAGTRKQKAPPRGAVGKAPAARKPDSRHAHGAFADPHAEREARRQELRNYVSLALAMIVAGWLNLQQLAIDAVPDISPKQVMI